jgi:hypothetical protein
MKKQKNRASKLLFTYKKKKMKYTIVTIVLACFLACSMFSCKNEKPVKMKTETEIYSEILKRMDSFINQSVAVSSVNRIKKLAKRIEQIGVSDELILDTLPDDSKIAFKRVNGRLEFYLNDAISTAQLYSVNVKESISGAVVALEIHERLRQRNCEHYRTVCADPTKNPRETDKDECALMIEYWCN